MAALSMFPPCLVLFPSYEVFLRGHQALAVTAICGLWIHLSHRPSPLYIYLWVLASVCAATSGLECVSMLYRNYGRHRGYSRVLIARQNGLVRMTIFTARPWKVKAGQYINICVPSVSFSSLFQSHPFTIASCDGDDGSRVDLLIEPRDGFTRKLYGCAGEYEIEEQDSPPRDGDQTVTRPFGFARRYPHSPQPSDFRLALFSGPHGLTSSAGDYGKVVLIAEDNGIAALMLMLKELIQDFNLSTVRTRHIYVIWQLGVLGM